MLEFLILLPLLTGLAVFALPVRMGRVVLAATGLLHLQLTLLGWLRPAQIGLPAFFAPTPAGMLVLLVTSFIFVFIAAYGIFYMREQEMRSEPVYLGCMLLFLGTMSMAALADHPIVLWIAIEATTLASAPLIFINRSKKALEATWKYVLICSVGIALALLGFFFITLSLDRAGLEIPLTFTSLNSVADRLDPLWLKTGFLFVLIGFGTKMGLAPLHFWLPDAHSEAPAPISALLSGALLNVALIPILRVDRLMRNSGLGEVAKELYLLMGFLSVFIAAVFVLKTKDFKRILAYSSIENMGLIMIAFGIGSFAHQAAYLHILGHSLVKAAFFLTAGNALFIYEDKNYENLGSLLKINRGSAWLWLISSMMIIGLPPSPLFTSKFFIATALLKEGAYLQFGLLMLLLTVVSWSIVNVGLKICLGDSERKQSLNALLYLSPTALLVLASVIGVFLPSLR